MITIKTARKHRKRELEQYAAGQLAKILEVLGPLRQQGESPAAAVKRLVDQAKPTRTQ
jgi:hypothetical protein